MENEDGAVATRGAAEQLRSQQEGNAMRAIQQQNPLPEIDFTIYTMEDGTQVSTKGRVCKGMEVIRRRASLSFKPPCSPPTPKHAT